MARLQFKGDVLKRIKVNSDSSMKEICSFLLQEKVEDAETGDRINAKVALCTKMFEHAMRGDSKYMSMLLNIIGEMPMSEADKTVIVPMLVNNIPTNANAG